jgi:(p)ppGpp synthase/HD superfamily hydrolase
MGWAEPKYSKGAIDRAGNALITLSKDDPARQTAIMIADNWRSCHGYPLQIIKMTLLNRATKLTSDALIAQRLKRRPSIELKLRDNQNMKLSQMQDIGGCYAILPTVRDVYKLVKIYKDFHYKSPEDRSHWDGDETSDYIERPKPDGYRSVHLVFRFKSDSAKRKVYNNQRIRDTNSIKITAPMGHCR